MYKPGKIILSLLLLLTASLFNALRAQTLPAAYSLSSKVNFVRIWEARAPLTDPAKITYLSPIDSFLMVTQYFDGLGRPVQTVTKQSSPAKKDLVVPVVYDSLGREQYSYLPFIANNTGGNTLLSDGQFKFNPFQQDSAFSQGQYPGETYYYSQVKIETSPLARVMKTYAPGNSWAQASGNKPVERQYMTSTVSDSVRIWTISSTSGSVPVSTKLYGAGQLFKEISIDEQSHQTIEYKDKDNRVVLKKIQLATSPGTAYVGWLSTYYVYDELNNLRFVLQPRAVELINTTAVNWVISSSIATEFCFRYEYDGRNRMIIKKIPGAGEVWMVYDARDRLVMDQDSLLRSTHVWRVNRYDNLNRPDTMGLLTDSNNRIYHQNLASGSTNYPDATGSNFAWETRTFYDDYSWVSGTFGGTGININSSLATKYTSNANYFQTSYNTVPAYAVPIVQNTLTRGAVTGTMYRFFPSAPFFYTVTIYDDHGRVIQTKGNNVSYGVDTTTIQYDFSGKPIRTLINHADLRNTNAYQYHKILTKMNYDAGFRLTSIRKNIDSAAADQLIDSMQYNELGQLKTKYLGNNLDNLAYDYNIRGWLTAINKSYLQSTGPAPLNYFGMELGYDKSTAAVGTTSYKGLQYTGNIAGTIWKSAGDGVNRQYDFSYDNVNRLTGADFNQQTSGGWKKNSATNPSVVMDLSTSNLSYDANGNIQTMSQRGFKLGGSSAVIDSLSYNYLINGNYGNKLNQVLDAANDTASLLGDFHYKGTKIAGTTDYTYDGNGNLFSDKNKGITSITYDFLNLPEIVTFANQGRIQYTYSTNGDKIRKIVWDNLSKHAFVTMYMGPFVYRYTDSIGGTRLYIDTLEYAAHEEGRARMAFHKFLNDSTRYGWEYDFFEKDHLGNTRVVLSQEKDTAQYIATMETAYRAKENALFYNIDSTAWPISSIPGVYPTDGTTTPNNYVAKVNGTVGTGHKMGPAILLKVMSGDSVAFGVKSFYKSGGTVGAPNSSLQDVLNSLAGGLMSVTGGAHGSISTLNTSGNPVYTALNSFLPTNDTSATTKPKAYLNWMLLDNQFNYVSTNSQSGAQQVGAPDVLNSLASHFKLIQSGYLYIWVSNETPLWDAFFDNLCVVTYNGPMLEENHYYPYGLTMAGISDKALKTQYAENKYRFNKGSELQNKEFSDGSGLELYETPLRSLDPQLGRWWQIDSKPDYAQSLYTAMGNNPILHNDALGDSVIIPFKGSSSPFNPSMPVGWEPKTPPAGGQPLNGQPDNESKSPKGSNEDKKPLVGVTSTTKDQDEASAGSDLGLGVVSIAKSTSVKKGTTGSLFNIDVSQKSTNGGPVKLDGVTVSSGPVSLKISADLSITGTMSVPLGNGNDIHVSLGSGKGLGQVGAGLGHKEGSGVGTSSDVSVRPGLGGVGAVGLGVILALNPELIPVAARLATQ